MYRQIGPARVARIVAVSTPSGWYGLGRRWLPAGSLWSVQKPTEVDETRVCRGHGRRGTKDYYRSGICPRRLTIDPGAPASCWLSTAEETHLQDASTPRFMGPQAPWKSAEVAQDIRLAF